MKTYFSRLCCLMLLNILISKTSLAGVEPIPSGSYIVNMGVLPQTYGNGMKPWGMLFDLIKNYKVQVKWVISQSKLKDGIDMTYNGTDYKGGTFIIPLKYRTGAVNTRIAYWQTQGVIGVTTTSAFNADVTYTLKYAPRWTFDLQNGAIATTFLDDAGIPSAGYPLKYPTDLGPCDDLFVMPHADPTWATHSNLFAWNQNNDGWIWAGCHAVSVLENLSNPANPSEKMNFLSQTGLVPFGSHGDGSPPYTYRFPNDPEMQFMGTTSAAQQNGSEQIFLPQGSTWRPTTKVAAYDPTQTNVPSISPGEAAAIVFGRGFGVSTNGNVMYVGGHNINKNNADAVAAMRNFFNFSFMSVYDKVVNFSIIGQINCIALNNYTYRASMPVGINPNLYTYHWTSGCGGSFSNPNDSVTLFTAPAASSCFDCRLICEISDTCGRQYYEDIFVTVCPGAPLSVNLVSFSGTKSGNDNLLQWKTSGETNSDHFELEYSTDGNNFLKIASIEAQGISSGLKDYSFLHQQILGKTAYYRLKIIDLDDKFRYSDVIPIKRDEIKYIVYPVYPNPFTEKMTVTIESETSATVELVLADLTGKIVKTRSALLKKGINKIELNQLGTLEPGTYFLRISNDAIINSMRLIKPGN